MPPLHHPPPAPTNSPVLITLNHRSGFPVVEPHGQRTYRLTASWEHRRTRCGHRLNRVLSCTLSSHTAALPPGLPVAVLKGHSPFSPSSRLGLLPEPRSRIRKAWSLCPLVAMAVFSTARCMQRSVVLTVTEVNCTRSGQLCLQRSGVLTEVRCAHNGQVCSQSSVVLTEVRWLTEVRYAHRSSIYSHKDSGQLCSRRARGELCSQRSIVLIES